MKVVWYRNSFLATVVSLLGTGFLLSGLLIAIEEKEILPGIILALLGTLLLWIGGKISDKKAEKNRIKGKT
ncbi:MAG: hypothetical protein IJ153_02850 [Clostridia bacterium]|nr:hypothetical protein [Clostridia bacterium]